MPKKQNMLQGSSRLLYGATFSSISFPSSVASGPSFQFQNGHFPDVTFDVKHIDGRFVIGGQNEMTGEEFEGGAESQFELMSELQRLLEEIYGEEIERG